MKSLPTFFFAVSIIFSSAFVYASGVLVDVNGKVNVSLPGGSASPGKIGSELPDGSVINVGAGSRASVMSESGAIDEIGAGSKYTVGSESAGSRRTNLGSGIAVAMRELAESGSRPTVHGMVKEMTGPMRNPPTLAALDEGGVAAIFPTGTAVRLVPEIAFRWSENPPMDWQKPALVIDDASMKHIVVKALEEKTNGIRIDTALAKLKKGSSYSWFLATQQGNLKGMTRRFEFRTLSDAEEKQVDEDIAGMGKLDLSEDGKNLLSAQLYLGRGLNQEAVELLVPLWQKDRAPFVKKLLSLGYSKMGREKEAEQYK